MAEQLVLFTTPSYSRRLKARRKAVSYRRPLPIWPLTDWAVLKRRFKTHCLKKGVYTSYKVHLIRYADDFVITGASKELLQNEILPIVREFLHARGLPCQKRKNEDNSHRQGFDFLGYNIRKYNGKLLIKPSKRESEKVYGQIRKTSKLIRSKT